MKLVDTRPVDDANGAETSPSPLALSLRPHEVEPGDILIGTHTPVNSILFDGSVGGWLYFDVRDRAIARRGVFETVQVWRHQVVPVESGSGNALVAFLDGNSTGTLNSPTTSTTVGDWRRRGAATDPAGPILPAGMPLAAAPVSYDSDPTPPHGIVRYTHGFYVVVP